MSEIKIRAAADMFKEASTIVDNVVQEIGDPALPPGSRPKTANLIRQANRVRERKRPKQPSDLDFVVNIHF